MENLSAYFFCFSAGFFSSALAFYAYEYGQGFGRKKIKDEITDEVSRFANDVYKNPDHSANYDAVIAEGTRLAIKRDLPPPVVGRQTKGDL